MRAPSLMLLVALTSQVPDFLFHHGLHQREPRFRQQVAHALPQHADDVGQRKDHLDVWILLGGDPAELLHGSLLFDLVLSLHSDSLLFLGRKINRRPIMAASLRVATFYDLPGNLCVNPEFINELHSTWCLVPPHQPMSPKRHRLHSELAEMMIGV
jgi:hypothetical protein